MSAVADQDAPYRHEAVLYADRDQFLEGTAGFVRDGLAAGEPALVALPGEHLRLVRDALGGDEHDGVRFIDMAVAGRNPARIIPFWRDFIAEHAGSGRRLRGIGEPVWHGRRPDELAECQQHEHLLNVAVPPDTPLWLRCPYDVALLGDDVVEEALRSHPHVHEGGIARSSDAFVRAGEIPPGFADPLPEPAASPATTRFELRDLGRLRDLVTRLACDWGVDPGRLPDVVLAANELATNSIRHGGGAGTLALWRDGGGLVCEVRDRGRVRDPLVGRRCPPADRPNGRGLWIVNHLCDLLQIRSSAEGTVVRARFDAVLAPAAG